MGGGAPWAGAAPVSVVGPGGAASAIVAGGPPYTGFEFFPHAVIAAMLASASAARESLREARGASWVALRSNPSVFVAQKGHELSEARTCLAHAGQGTRNDIGAFIRSVSHDNPTGLCCFISPR